MRHCDDEGKLSESKKDDMVADNLRTLDVQMLMSSSVADAICDIETNVSCSKAKDRGKIVDPWLGRSVRSRAAGWFRMLRVTSVVCYGSTKTVYGRSRNMILTRMKAIVVKCKQVQMQQSVTRRRTAKSQKR